MLSTEERRNILYNRLFHFKSPLTARSKRFLLRVETVSLLLAVKMFILHVTPGMQDEPDKAVT